MPEDIVAQLEAARKRLKDQQQLILKSSLNDTADITRRLNNLRSQQAIAGPVISPMDIAFQGLDSPLDLQLQQQKEEDESKLMKTWEFIAEVSGIPSIFRAAVTALPEGAESTVRETDLPEMLTRKASTGDFVVSAITLFGGFGIKGALKLIGLAGEKMIAPVLKASASGVRAAGDDMIRANKLMEGIRAGQLPAISGVGHVPERLTTEELRYAVDYVTEAVNAGKNVIDDPQVQKIAGRLFKKVGGVYELGIIEDVEIVGRVMKDLGMTNTKTGRIAFARLLESGISESARVLKSTSDLRKALGKILTQDELIAAGMSDIQAAGNIYRVTRGTINFWRGSITAQLTTAVRNLEVGLVRMPLQFFEDIGSGAVKQFTGQTGMRASFMPAFENLTALWRGMKPTTRRGIEKILKQVDESEGKMIGGQSTGLWRAFYQTPASDVTGTGKVLDFLQIANRTQENLARSVAFDAMVSKRLLQAGIDKAKVFSQGAEAFGGVKSAQWKTVRGILKEGTESALEVTFALRPSGKMWNHLFKVYEEFPPAALIHPFPRFFANSIRFFKQHSPVGLMDYMSKSQRNAIVNMMTAKGAAGGVVQREATEALGKAMTGFMMFSGAMALRNTDMAGDRWYEIKVGDKVIDARPFNPLAAYMLLGEQMRQIANPDQAHVPLKTRDFVEAFAGIRRFAGTGLFIFNFFDSDLTAFEGGMKRTAAEMVGGFTQPLRTFKDFLSIVKPDEAVFRAKDEGGLFGPAIGNVPFLGAALQSGVPRSERAGEVGAEEPLSGAALPLVGAAAGGLIGGSLKGSKLGIPGAIAGGVAGLAGAIAGKKTTPGAIRQASGMLSRTRTDVESELIRNDVSARPFTGDPKLDREITKISGPEVDKRLSKLISSRAYQRMNPVQQREKLGKEVGKIKSRAKKQVLSRDRKEIMARVEKELSGKSRNVQLRELEKMQSRGRITEAMKRSILSRLR